MPKLTIPQRSKGKAVSYLLKLYKKEPDFIRELNKLRAQYHSSVAEWLKVSVPKWINMKEVLSPQEFRIARDCFLGASDQLPENFLNKLEHLLPKPNQELAQKLDAYEKALGDLAYRWHLRASWAGQVLVQDHVMDLITNMMPEDERNVELPIEILEPFLPSAPLPPLQFEVSAYEFLFSTRKEIQNKFANKLADYENRLKDEGWTEVPSAIKRHAIWWFEHYVHNKTHDEIAQMEIHTPGGSLISYARNVGTAVRNFSKLIGLDPKYIE